jgi:hypothetical protein
MIINAIPSAKIIISPLNLSGYIYFGSKDYREILSIKFRNSGTLFSDDAVTTLKYCKRSEALIPLSAFMTKALFVFQVCQDGCDV